MADSRQPRIVDAFVVVSKDLLYDATIPPLALRLYLIIGDQAQREGGDCTRPHAELAHLIGRSERTVGSLLRLLVRRRLIGSRTIGQGQAKAYWLTARPEGGR